MMKVNLSISKRQTPTDPVPLSLSRAASLRPIKVPRSWHDLHEDTDELVYAKLARCARKKQQNLLPVSGEAWKRPPSQAPVPPLRPKRTHQNGKGVVILSLFTFHRRARARALPRLRVTVFGAPFGFE